MSNRAEELAVRIHNTALRKAEKHASEHGMGVLGEVSYGWGFKAGAITGYEQAEKDTIERVIEWVKRNGYLYVNRVKEGDEYVGEFMEEPFIESLRKAMEDKK